MSLLSLPIIFVLAWTLSGAASADIQKIAQQVELRPLQSKMDGLRKELAYREHRRAEISRELQEAERAVASGSQVLIGLRDAHKQAHSELVHLEAKLSRVQLAIEKSRTQFIDLLRTRYKAGHSEALRLLLSQQNPSITVREIAYYRYLAEARQKWGSSLQAEHIRLHELASIIREKREKLALLVREQENSRRKWISEGQTKQRLIKGLDLQIRAQERQIEKLMENEEKS